MRKSVLLTAVVSLTASIPAIGSAATDGKNRKILVENMTNHTINNFYASPVEAKTWEENLLGERSLPSGKSIQANIDNGTNDCYYDLEVVLDDSRKIVHRAVNVCASAKWVIGEAQDSVE